MDILLFKNDPSIPIIRLLSNFICTLSITAAELVKATVIDTKLQKIKTALQSSLQYQTMYNLQQNAITYNTNSETPTKKNIIYARSADL